MSDARTAYEQIQTVHMGVNDLLDPMLLKEGYAARLLNVEVRNGLAESRPALFGETMPAQGRFQGAFSYELEGNLRWVVVVSGHVWTYSFATNAWLDVAAFPTVDFDQAYFCQAGKFCIVQNGVYDPVENWPIILHGDLLVDNLETTLIYRNHVVKVKDFNWDMIDGNDAIVVPAPPGNPSVYRVPIGKSMAFGQGRLFVAVERYWDNGLASGLDPGWRSGEGLRFILASDDWRWDDPARMLAFTQNDLLTGGGALSLPAESGFVTSLAFFRNAATGTGLGELIAICRRGVSAFAVSVARESWGTEGFGQVLFQTSGSNSPWALSAVNADLVYRGHDGLRTIKYSASGETSSGGMAVVPLSPEVSTLVGRTDAGHEPFVTLAAADNYVLFTSNGIRLGTGDVAFFDVLPWDLATFQASGEQSSRTFAGAWRGPLFHSVLKVSDRQAGAIFRRADNAPLQYGIFSDIARDATQVSAVRTQAFAFKAARNLKRFKYADLIFDRVSTALEVKVRWRVDGGGWYESDVRRFSSTYPKATGIFRVPALSDNDGTGYVFEFAVVWTGHARLKLAAFAAAVLDEFNGGDERMCATVDLDAEPARGVAWSPEE